MRLVIQGALPGGVSDARRPAEDARARAARTQAAAEELQAKLVATREKVMKTWQLLARSDEAIRRPQRLLVGDDATPRQHRRPSRALSQPLSGHRQPR